MWNTVDDRYSIWRTKLEHLSSIVFHTVLVARKMPKQTKQTNVSIFLNRAKLEYLSSIVFHTVLVAKNMSVGQCGILSMIDTPYG